MSVPISRWLITFDELRSTRQFPSFPKQWLDFAVIILWLSHNHPFPWLPHSSFVGELPCKQPSSNLRELLLALPCPVFLSVMMWLRGWAVQGNHMALLGHGIMTRCVPRRSLPFVCSGSLKLLLTFPLQILQVSHISTRTRRIGDDE